MNNNDILRRLRYALNIRDHKMIKIYANVGLVVDNHLLEGLLKKEGERGFTLCGNDTLNSFLDGLIIERRGPAKPPAGGGQPQANRFTNNLILRKLRIALEMKDADMLAVMNSGGATVSKSELSALFRKESHRHYKKCGDQFLRTFINGLTVKYRGPAKPAAEDKSE